MDVGPIEKVFDALIQAGSLVSLSVSAFFVMLAGFPYISAGGSARAVESAKSSRQNAAIGLAVVVLCKVFTALEGNALGLSANSPTGLALAPTFWMLSGLR